MPVQTSKAPVRSRGGQGRPRVQASKPAPRNREAASAKGAAEARKAQVPKPQKLRFTLHTTEAGYSYGEDQQGLLYPNPYDGAEGWQERFEAGIQGVGEPQTDRQALDTFRAWAAEEHRKEQARQAREAETAKAKEAREAEQARKRAEREASRDRDGTRPTTDRYVQERIENVRRALIERGAEKQAEEVEQGDQQVGSKWLVLGQTIHECLYDPARKEDRVPRKRQAEVYHSPDLAHLRDMQPSLRSAARRMFLLDAEESRDPADLYRRDEAGNLIPNNFVPPGLRKFGIKPGSPNHTLEKYRKARDEWAKAGGVELKKSKRGRPKREQAQPGAVINGVKDLIVGHVKVSGTNPDTGRKTTKALDRGDLGDFAYRLIEEVSALKNGEVLITKALRTMCEVARFDFDSLYTALINRPVKHAPAQEEAREEASAEEGTSEPPEPAQESVEASVEASVEEQAQQTSAPAPEPLQVDASLFSEGQQVALTEDHGDFPSGALGKIEGQANGALIVRIYGEDEVRFIAPEKLRALA